MSLVDKVAVITGAASGLGEGIAKKFAEQKARIVIADIAIDKAETTAEAIRYQYNVEAMAIGVDITEPEAVSGAVEQIIDKYQQIDILVNNAGIQTISPFVDFTYADWQRLMKIHVDGSFLMSQACLRVMQHQHSGSIIFIGSIHSVEASLNKAAYITAKHGLVGMMRAIAKEGAPYGIRSNLVAPGFVWTPLVEKQIPEQAKALGITEEEVVKRIMLGNTVDGEFTTIDDVAAVTLFFADFPTNALTGQSLLVTHGWHME